MPETSATKNQFSPDDILETGNQYTDQYIASARFLGLAVDVIDPSNQTVVISGNGRRLIVRGAILGCNNLIAAKISSNKFLTNARLSSAGFRVPRFREFHRSDYFEYEVFFEALHEQAASMFPVVLKPVKGHGGHQVYAGIQNEDHLDWAARKIYVHGDTDILLEKHAEGLHYRLKFFDDELVDVIVRKPAFVIGDGVSTIAELVENKNAIKKEENISVIDTSEKMKRTLERYSMSLKSVLNKGQEQVLHAESNQSLGGDSCRLAVDIVHPDTVRYFSEVSRFCGLRWLGLDFIVDDISSPKAHATGYINETNSAPVPNEFAAGRTLEDYLNFSRYVLERYFQIQV